MKDEPCGLESQVCLTKLISNASSKSLESTFSISNWCQLCSFELWKQNKIQLLMTRWIVLCVGDKRSNWFVFSILIKLFVPLKQDQNCRSSEKTVHKKGIGKSNYMYNQSLVCYSSHRILAEWLGLDLILASSWKKLISVDLKLLCFHHYILKFGCFSCIAYMSTKYCTINLCYPLP